MRKFPAYLLAILVGAVIWGFFSYFKIEGTENVRVVPKTAEELNRTPSAETSEEKPSFLEGLRGAIATARTKQTNSTEISDPVGTRTENVNPPSVTDRDNSISVKQTNLTIGARKRADSIRVGSFHLHHFGSAAADPKSVDIVAKVIRYFDIIALQGIAPGGKSAVLDAARKRATTKQFSVHRPMCNTRISVSLTFTIAEQS